MKILAESEKDVVLNILRDNLKDCLYMYIDISKYGLDNPNLWVWVNEDYSIILMRYFGSISIYSTDDADLSEAAKVILFENVKTLSGEKSVINRLFKLLEGSYDVEYGYVFKFEKYGEIDTDIKVEFASLNDMGEIAGLICENKHFKGMYDKRNLADQLAERYSTGMGRSYIVRDGDKIIAHIASYAEYDGIATTSGLVVDETYQNGLYMRVLEAYLVNRLWEDGYDVYTFVTDRLRMKYLKLLKNDLISEYGKLVKKG